VCADDAIAAVSEVRRLEERVRELERLLGRGPWRSRPSKEAPELTRDEAGFCCRARRQGDFR
jgi:hypothetical protein